VIDDPSRIVMHSALTMANLLSVPDKLFPYSTSEELVFEQNYNTISVTIRTGVTYNAIVESGVGSGHFHAA